MNSFSDVVAKFNKEFKTELVSKGISKMDYDLIPFTSPMANYILHGGIPEGRIVEFFGPEGSGKTTSAIDIMKNAQIKYLKTYEEELQELEQTMGNKKQLISKYNEMKEKGPKKIVFFDLEQSFDYVWATTLGLDVEKIFFVRPEAQSAEELLDLIVQMFSSEEVGLIVLDSITSLVSRDELEKDLTDAEMRGGVSKILGKFFRKSLPFMNKAHATLILINQVRDSMNPYEIYTTPGGRAVKHHCSVRLFFRKASLLDEKFDDIKRNSERAYGNIVQIKLEKTKVCKPDRLLGSYTLCYYTGIEDVVDLVDMLIGFNMIVKGGSWFTFVDVDTGEPLYENDKELKIQGRSNVIQYLKENQDLLDYYYDYVNKIVKEK